MKIKTWSGRQVLCLLAAAGLLLGGGCKGKNARGNRAPVVMGVEIRPPAPGPGQDLNVSVQYRDEDGDAVVLDYRWTVNGKVKQEGSGLSTLPGSLVTAGARIGLEVRVRDAEHAGDWVAGHAVQVPAEAEVKLRGVRLEPAEAFRSTTLEAKVDLGDAAPESLTLYYRWLKNDAVVENASDSTLADAFQRGDSVLVEVSTDSEFAAGKTWHSNPMRIKNIQPEIKSEPNFTWDGEKFVYQMEAADADGDNLTYFLESGPAGMTVDPKTGLVTWKPGPNAAGTYQARVGVDDGHGGKAGQVGQLDLAAKPAAP